MVASVCVWRQETTIMEGILGLIHFSRAWLLALLLLLLPLWRS